MQTRHFVLALALGGLIGLAAGCEKKTEVPPVQPAKADEGKIQKQVDAAADAAKETAQKAVTAVTAPATQAVQAASQAATDGTAKAQTIIDSAKKSISEGKWQEAGQTLPKLQGLKLTPEQEKSLMDLKAQLEKLVQDAMSKQPALPGGVVPGK
jgi:hypothetical protein